MTRKDLLIPQVHLNGNSAESLMEEVSEIRDVVLAAMRKMNKMEMSHGRNWYHTENHPEAILQHVDRFEKLNDVVDELNAIYWSLIEQQQARSK